VITKRIARWFDDRLRASSFAHHALNKVFPDDWSFMLGEIALYAFVVLVLTGTFLTFFFEPSSRQIVYHGSYAPLRGVSMSEAYASTLSLSFDIRGGLLLRQISGSAIVSLAAQGGDVAAFVSILKAATRNDSARH